MPAAGPSIRLACSLCACAAAALAGCDTAYTPVDRTDRRPRELQLTDLEGGTHWRTVVTRGRWYQSFGPDLLVLSCTDGAQIDALDDILPDGKSGALVDAVEHEGDLVVLLDRTAVARVDCSNERDHVVTEIMLERDLGMRPEELSVADGGLFVSGLGGIVRLDTGERFLAAPGRCGRVVPAAPGLVTTRGKDIVRLSDGTVVGLATDLQPLPDGVGPKGGLAFILQQSGAARVGIMSSELRELAGAPMPGEVRRVRVIGDRLWAVGAREVESWRIVEGPGGSVTLTEPRTVSVRGACDIDQAGPNTYCIAGTFGRSLYRLDADDRGASDQFFASHREPGRLDQAYGDQRRIMAGSDEGMWIYTMGADLELTDRELRVVSLPKSSVEGAFGQASIEGTDDDPLTVEQGFRVIVTGGPGGRTEIGLPQGSRAHTLEAIDGDLWIGHDDGIDVWRPGTGGMRRVARVRLQGPVTHIFPRRVGNSAGFVTLLGGMGVVEWKPVDAPTPLPSLPPSQPSAAPAAAPASTPRSSAGR